MKNFEKVTMDDFLAEGELQSNLMKISKKLSNSRSYLTESFELDDYYTQKLYESSDEELNYISESISKSNIEKADFILEHANDKLVKDIYLSKGNVTNMHYYATIQKMIKDLSLVNMHNPELEKAKEILYDLEREKQIYMKAFSNGNIYKKTVYFSSVMSAFFTIIKEHLSAVDFTTSKNEGKLVLNRDQHHVVVDKDNIVNLEHNLSLIRKRRVDPNTIRNYGPKTALSESDVSILLAQNNRNNFLLLSEGASLVQVDNKVSLADGDKPLNIQLNSGTFTDRTVEEFKSFIAKFIDLKNEEEKKFFMDNLSKIKMYFINKDKLSKEDIAMIEKHFDPSTLASIENSKMFNVVKFFSAPFENIKAWAHEAFSDVPILSGEIIPESWKSYVNIGLICVSALGALYTIVKLKSLKMILYLDSYEYIKDAASKGQSNNDRRTYALIDKISDLKKFLLRIWMDKSSKNIQDYMKDLQSDVSIIRQYEDGKSFSISKEEKKNLDVVSRGLDFSSLYKTNNPLDTSSLKNKMSHADTNVSNNKPQSSNNDMFF